MEIPSFFVIVFAISVGVWPAASLIEKGGHILRFDTYANCERSMIAFVELSPITKGFDILKGKYGTKIVRVNLPNGDKGTYACFEIDK